MESHRQQFRPLPCPALMRHGVRRFTAGAKLPLMTWRGPTRAAAERGRPRYKSQITELGEEYVVKTRSWRGRRGGHGQSGGWRAGVSALT